MIQIQQIDLMFGAVYLAIISIARAIKQFDADLYLEIRKDVTLFEIVNDSGFKTSQNKIPEQSLRQFEWLHPLISHEYDLGLVYNINICVCILFKLITSAGCFSLTDGCAQLSMKIFGYIALGITIFFHSIVGLFILYYKCVNLTQVVEISNSSPHANDILR